MLIRIVCQELESWFLGDLEAVRSAIGRLPAHARQDSRIFRDPDRLTNAADDLKKLTGTPGTELESDRRTGAVDPEMFLRHHRARVGHHNAAAVLKGLNGKP